MSKFSLVMLLDEFDTILSNEQFEIEFFNNLRAMANEYTQLMYITATSRELHMLTHSKAKGSPFFNIFHYQYLLLFEKEEAVSLIEQYLENQDSPFDDDDIEFLFKLSGFYPFFFQMGANYLYDAYLRGNILNKHGLYQEIQTKFCEQSESHFEYFWSNANKDEQAVLSEIVSQGSLSVAKIDAEIYRNLSNRSLFIKHKNTVSVFCHPFALWIKRHSKKTVDESLEPKIDESSQVTSTSSITEKSVEENLGYGSTKPMIFISHSSEDKQFAHYIREALLKLPIEVFLDERNIKYGEPINEKLIQGLRQCNAVILIVSKKSANSDWVKYELGAAWALDKHIVPVQLNSTKLFSITRGLKYIDATRDQIGAMREIEKHFAEWLKQSR